MWLEFASHKVHSKVTVLWHYFDTYGDKTFSSVRVGRQESKMASYNLLLWVINNLLFVGNSFLAGTDR